MNKEKEIRNIEKKREAIQKEIDEINIKRGDLDDQYNKLVSMDDDCARQLVEILKDDWTIYDAKPGDILVTTKYRKLVFLFRGLENRSFTNKKVLGFHCYVDLDAGSFHLSEGDEFMGNVESDDICPALPRSVKKLKREMKKNGYDFNEETNTLVEI